MNVEVALDVRAELGEGPLWDGRRQRMLFVDIMRGHLHEFDPASGRDRIDRIGRPVGCVALAEHGDWIVAASDGFYRVDPGTGGVKLMAPVEADIRDNRMNDGYVDALGRFWAGTMSVAGQRDRGTLYRLDPDGRVRRMLSPVSISNGLDWSPDNRILYYVDLVLSRIDQFDFDLATGNIKNRRTFVGFPPRSAIRTDSLSMPKVLCGWRCGKADRSTGMRQTDASISSFRCRHRRRRSVLLAGRNCGICTSPRPGEAWMRRCERASRMQASLFRVRTGARGKPVHRFDG